jgi:hypothetical protein
MSLRVSTNPGYHQGNSPGRYRSLGRPGLAETYSDNINILMYGIFCVLRWFYCNKQFGIHTHTHTRTVTMCYKVVDIVLVSSALPRCFTASIFPSNLIRPACCRHSHQPAAGLLACPCLAEFSRSIIASICTYSCSKCVAALLAVEHRGE